MFSDDCFVTGKLKEYNLEDGIRISLNHSLFDDDAIVLCDMPHKLKIKSDLCNKEICVSYPGVKYLGIWHWPKKDAPYVCIEPWSSLPSRKDVVEEFSTKPDLLSLKPGEKYQFDITIEI